MENNPNYHVATPLFLWGLAVSAVIIGEFAGWNEGLIEGGFGGMLAAVLIATLMFACLSATYSELATAIPFTGGAFAYSRAAFNPTMAFITGISQAIEYIATLATVLASVQITTQSLLEEYYGIKLPIFGTWTVYTIIFAILNMWDARIFYRSALALSIASIGALIFFCIKALPFFDINLLLNIPPQNSGTKWLPEGIIGVAWCLPFAIWLFVVLEIISLAPEDSKNAKTAIPKAFYASFITILVLSMLVLFLVPGVGLGAAGIASHNNSYRVALEFVTNNQLPALVVILLVMSGPLAGYHSTIFAASKVIFSLSRAGYLPSGLAKISEKRQTPHMAIIFVSVIVLVILACVNLFTDPRGSVPILLNMAILGAIISYSMTFISYICLATKYPKMRRHYISPLGVTGAMAGLIISTITTFLMFTNAKFISALGICILIIFLGLVHHYLHGKNKLNHDSPEEAFARHLQSHLIGEKE